MSLYSFIWLLNSTKQLLFMNITVFLFIYIYRHTYKQTQAYISKHEVKSRSIAKWLKQWYYSEMSVKFGNKKRREREQMWWLLYYTHFHRVHSELASCPPHLCPQPRHNLCMFPVQSPCWFNLMPQWTSALFSLIVVSSQHAQKLKRDE